MENMGIFGRWTVLSREGFKWLCRCSCGTERLVPRSDLRAGKSKSCGICVRKEIAENILRKRNRTHGLGDSPEMRTWTDMRRRCHNPNRPDYKNYGARGIYVCDRWRNSFSNFLEDMGRRPEGKTLERIDNDGPYSPENCTWADPVQQGSNRRTNVFYDFLGEKLTISQAAVKYGIDPRTIRSRITLRGWSSNDAVTKPVRKIRSKSST